MRSLSVEIDLYQSENERIRKIASSAKYRVDEKFQNFQIFKAKFWFSKSKNRDSHIASSLISQSSFFEKVCCLILTSPQRKLHGYIEILKFDITIKKIKKFKLV